MLRNFNCVDWPTDRRTQRGNSPKLKTFLKTIDVPARDLNFLETCLGISTIFFWRPTGRQTQWGREAPSRSLKRRKILLQIQTWNTAFHLHNQILQILLYTNLFEHWKFYTKYKKCTQALFAHYSMSAAPPLAAFTGVVLFIWKQSACNKQNKLNLNLKLI